MEKKLIELESFDIKKKIKENEEGLNSLSIKLNETNKNSLEGDENLKKKFNKLKKHLDNQILQLNSKLELFLNNIGEKGEDGESDGKNIAKKFDLSGLNSFMEKIINLENKFEDFISVSKTNELFEQIKNLDNKKAEKADLKKYRSDFKELTKKFLENKENIDNIFKDIESMSKKISDINIMQEKIKNMKMKNIEEGVSSKEVKQNDNVDVENKISLDAESLDLYLSKYVLKSNYDDFLKINKEKINKIDDEIDKINNQINEMTNSLNKKSDIEDLSELRDFLTKKLEVFNNENTKKFSDKNETLKYFKYFEEQIKNFTTSKVKSESHTPENWLLAAKPINGFSCAACESYIGDLKLEKDKFIAWNKLPTKEGEKVYRMGNGFSKMLSMLNVDGNGDVYINPNIDSNNFNVDESKNESKKKEKNSFNTLLIKNRSKKDLMSFMNENRNSLNKIGKRSQNNFFKKEQIKSTYLPKLKKEISVENENIKENEENPKITKIFKKSHSKIHIKENN